MKAESRPRSREQLGADRVLEPARRAAAAGRAPRRLRPGARRTSSRSRSSGSASTRPRSATSASAPTATPSGWPARILEIVAERGKMHNPETDSGGILLGHGRRGRRALRRRRPRSAPRIATLGSLTLTPLRLDEVDRLDPDSPQVEVDGHRLRLRARRRGRRCPTTCPLTTALELFDVCARRLADCATSRPASGTVCVLGAGHAGKLALAAARDAHRRGTLVAVDVDAGGGRAVADARPLRRRRRRRPARPARGARGGCAPPASAPADLTVVVVNATGCEPAAILLTADGGTVLFFSMATQLLGRRAGRRRDRRRASRMLIGSGYAPDRGAYALDLVRRSRAAAPSARHSRRGAGVSATATRCRCAGATSTGSATSTTRSSSPTSRRAATLPRRPRDQPRRVRGRPLRGQLPRRDRPRARGGHRRSARSRELGTLERDHERADRRPRRARSLVEAEFGLVLWDPEQPGVATDHRRGARLARRAREAS